MDTELDPNSVIELLKYNEEEIFSEPSYDKDFQSRKEQYSTSIEYCKEHPEETVSYFCFLCESECICAECVIHGEHKDHDVLQIKKAYPLIKDKIEEMYLYLSNKIDEVILRGEKIENHKKEIIDQGNAAKQQASINFDDLKARLEKKEREIIGNIDKIVRDALKEADNFNRILSGKINALGNTSEIIKKILATSSQVELLDFYAENKEKVYSNIDSELTTLGNIDRTANLRCFLSTSSLAEHMDSIKSVQIQISSLKSPDEPSKKSVSEKTKRVISKNV